MIERLEVEVRPFAHLPESDVVLIGLAVGHLRLGQVGEGDEELFPSPVELAELRLELLELGLQRGRLLTQLRELGLVDLSGPGRLLDLRGELVLLGPDRVDPRVQLAPALVDVEELVDLLARAPPGQRRSDPLRVGADLLQVERGSLPELYGAAAALVVVWAGAGASVTSRPAYFATKAATFCVSAPTTMFWGMIAPEKPPFRIA